METHYNNPKNANDFASINMRQKADSSGLKLYYTDKLRKYDAGILSIGKKLLFSILCITIIVHLCIFPLPSFYFRLRKF